MRKLLILSGIGILSTAAWIVTGDTGALAQDRVHGPGGRGGTHGGGFEGQMKHGTRSPAHSGLGFQPEMRSILYAGEPEPGPAAPGMTMGALVVGGPEHNIAGHLVGPVIHLLTHDSERVDPGMGVTPQPTAPGGAESDQARAATA